MHSAPRKWISLSPFRRNIAEIMRLARTAPLVTAERKMNLAPLVDARRSAALPLSWSAIFSKAFALVAGRRPELRRALMRYPWPRLYQHPVSVVSIILERTWNDEDVAVPFRIRNPASFPLVELHEMLLNAKHCPFEELKQFRQYRRMGSLPWGLRQLMWNFAYYWRGEKRAHYFGTFALSSTASAGAGLTTILSPVACTLHYGLFDELGRLDMRLTFDHRVIDGAPVARALADLEQTLLMEVLSEVRELSVRGQRTERPGGTKDKRQADRDLSSQVAERAG